MAKKQNGFYFVQSLFFFFQLSLHFRFRYRFYFCFFASLKGIRILRGDPDTGGLLYCGSGSETPKLPNLRSWEKIIELFMFSEPHSKPAAA